MSFRHRFGVGEDVGVREHHALGPPGRAGRVDERRECVRVAGVVFRQRCVRGQPARHRAPRDAGGGVLGLAVVETQDARERGKLAAERREPLPLRRRLDQHEPRARVAEDVRDVAGVVGRVKRNHHQAEALRGLVEADPGYAVRSEHRDAVAPREAFARQRRPPAADRGLHVPPCVAVPAAGRGVVPAVRLGVGRARAAAQEQARQRARLGSGDQVERAGSVH